MSSSSSVRSGLRGRAVAVPLAGCPDCGDPVTFYRSTTNDHYGWVFYKCNKHTVTCDFWRWELEYVQHLIETRVLVGNAAVDALGAAEERREELEMRRNEANAGRRGNACRVNFGSPSEKNFATKQQAAMLLGLGREILMVMKLVLASVMVLCVLCFILILKN